MKDKKKESKKISTLFLGLLVLINVSNNASAEMDYNADINDPAHQFDREDSQKKDPSVVLEKRTPEGLTQQQCRQVMINHKANPSVVYHIDADEKDNPIAPADLYPRPSCEIDQDRILLDLNVPLHRKKNNKGYKLSHGPFPLEAPIDMGTVVIAPDGNVYINGDYVGDSHRKNIENHCRETFTGM